MLEVVKELIQESRPFQWGRDAGDYVGNGAGALGALTGGLFGAAIGGLTPPVSDAWVAVNQRALPLMIEGIEVSDLQPEQDPKQAQLGMAKRVHDGVIEGAKEGAGWGSWLGYGVGYASGALIGSTAGALYSAGSWAWSWYNG